MDYVKGDTLRDVVAFGGAQSEKDAVRIILQVADVLAAAQCFGMVHRDLKPENIMLTEDGVVKLLDLGVAKISEGFDSLKTKANTVFGTPAYISPEQALDASTVDTRADIYSLGVILFELLAGQRPYTGNDPTEVLQQLLSKSPIPDVRNFNSKVSPKISAVLSLMCAKRLEDRLATPKAVIETFARLGYALPASASAEIAPDAGGEGGDGPSMDELISHLPSKLADSSLEMETQDAEIQAFVSRLKQKRLMHRLILVGIGVAVVLTVVLAILLIKGK
jgi:serine/threonine-protein kinase